MKIYIINGPNINMLGIREPDIYGKDSYAELCRLVSEHCDALEIFPIFYQSNHEGDLVDKIQEAYFEGADGIVINPAAYTHTSIAILDAVKAVGLPTVEVHISRVDEREEYRRISYVREAVIKTISGEGLCGYCTAVDVLAEFIQSGKV